MSEAALFVDAEQRQQALLRHYIHQQRQHRSHYTHRGTESWSAKHDDSHVKPAAAGGATRQGWYGN